MEQLLTTKLYIPQTRPAIVSRPRLIKRMNESLQSKLALVSAPAGLLSLSVNGESVTPRLNNLFRRNIPIKGEVTPVDIVLDDNEGLLANH